VKRHFLTAIIIFVAIEFLVLAWKGPHTLMVRCIDKAGETEYYGMTMRLDRHEDGSCEFDEVGTGRHWVCERCE
jgi:hypothetical protein